MSFIDGAVSVINGNVVLIDVAVVLIHDNVTSD